MDKNTKLPLQEVSRKVNELTIFSTRNPLAEQFRHLERMTKTMDPMHYIAKAYAVKLTAVEPLTEHFRHVQHVAKSMQSLKDIASSHRRVVEAIAFPRSMMAFEPMEAVKIEPRNEAKQKCSLIQAEIHEFEQKLQANEQIGIKLHGAADASACRLESIAWIDRHTIKLEVIDASGQAMTHLLHHSQANVALVAVQIDPPIAKRLGFLQT